MSKEIKKLRDYSSLFTRKEVLSWEEGDFSSIRAKIKRYDSNVFCKSGFTYLEYLKNIYSIVEDSFRNEYVIKNLLLNKKIIDQQKQGSFAIYNEFRAGKSIADLATFNGKAIAYEIKSEFDSPYRLKSQLNEYTKFFHEAYLVIPKSKYNVYKKFIPRGVGLILLDDNKNLEVDRDSINLDYDIRSFIMSSLRTKEYISIVKNYLGYLPKMTSFTQFDICRKIIGSIPENQLQNIYLNQIKLRKSENALSNKTHKEFNQIFLSMGYTKKQKAELIKNLKQKVQ